MMKTWRVIDLGGALLAIMYSTFDRLPKTLP